MAVSRGALSKAYAVLNLAAALYLFVYFGIYFDGARHGTAWWAIAILPGCPLWLAEAVARVRSVFKRQPEGTQRYVVTARDDLPPGAPRPAVVRPGTQPLTVGRDGKIGEGKDGR